MFWCFIKKGAFWVYYFILIEYNKAVYDHDCDRDCQFDFGLFGLEEKS